MRNYSAYFFSRFLRDDSGQAGLVVLLMTVVVLTMGISIASRSQTDVQLSRQEEESNQVFNAAEVGVEKALSQDPASFSNSLSETIQVGETQVNYQISKVNLLEARVFEGTSLHIDVSTAGLGNTLQIDWGKESCSVGPASILVIVFSNTFGVPQARSFGFNPNCVGFQSPNGFTTVSSAGSSPYNHRATINLQIGDQFVRVKPLYKDTFVNIRPSGGWTMPTQFYRVVAQASNDRGDERRQVEVHRTLPAAPALFDFVLYSGTSIIKN